MRQILTAIHRYVGLVMASFLVIAGLTGTMLAWYHELDRAMNRDLMEVNLPHDNAVRLDAVALREKVQQRFPASRVHHVDLQNQAHHALIFHLAASVDAVSGKKVALENDEVFVNPYTGDILGARKWGDLSQGTVNLLPFLYRFHYSLALGDTGTLIFGIIALAWTVDCFVGVYLTFPLTKKNRSSVAQRPEGAVRSWLARWRPAWKVRLRSGKHKTNFDIHRACGLWLWAIFFVLAWSAVGFNLRQVHSPVMRSLFSFQHEVADMPKLVAPLNIPALDWQTALHRGRELMQVQARNQAFTILSERALTYDAIKGVYRYRVRSSRDVSSNGSTSLYFDAQTGEKRAVFLPTGEAAGDTINTWLNALHMATVGGTPYRLLMTLVGLIVVALTVTGVAIWLKKRQARRAYRLQLFWRDTANQNDRSPIVSR